MGLRIFHYKVLHEKSSKSHTQASVAAPRSTWVCPGGRKTTKKSKKPQGVLIFIQKIWGMTLKEILENGEIIEHTLCSPVSVEEPEVRCQPLTLEGNGAVVHFGNQRAGIQLTGYGPFRFRGLVFRHADEMGASFFLCQDATVVFEDCTFEGAYGGPEEALAAAVILRGKSRAVFEECRFGNNDLHLVVAQEAHCSVHRCQFDGARADGLRVSGNAELVMRQSQVRESGWSGLSAGDRGSLKLEHCELVHNGCHGVELLVQARYHGEQNRLKENGYNGLAVCGGSTVWSSGDRTESNMLCGLDVGEDAVVSMQNLYSENNAEHGTQLRDTARAVFRDCHMSGNGKSGVALFGDSHLQAEALSCEANTYGGIQATGQARLNLDRAAVSHNRVTGMALFGRSRVNAERSRIKESSGHGIQFADESYGFLRDCEVMENLRSGVVFAGHSRGTVESNTLAHNKANGLVTSDQSKVTAFENLIRSNEHDGAMIVSRAACQLLENLIEKNGRYGLYAGPGAKPLLSDNLCEDNRTEQVFLETSLGRLANRSATKQGESSSEIPAGVTISTEDGEDLHLPFQPKKLEKTMLLALAKHGRLSEQALGKVANTRRVGGAIENLIDRLNKAGMPMIRHDGDGPEGNIYAFKLDTSRTRPQRNDKVRQTQGREIC